MKKAEFKTILVPVDFSKLSRPAIELAKELARKSDASIHLVHVHEFIYPPNFMAPLPLSVLDYRDDSALRRKRRLHVLAKRAGLAGENFHLLEGAPTFNEICNLAREIAADLIVMPTHGYTGVARLFAGSTAERVVQHSPCPVLVARESRKRPLPVSANGRKRGIDTILVPVDFSQASLEALEYAIDFAERVAARLILLHVVDFGVAVTADGYGMYNLAALEEGARKDAELQMQSFVRLVKFRRVDFETAVRVASPMTEIDAFASQHEIDLIIMATHGRTGFKHLLIGSVAERVVRSAARSVLVVPSHPERRARKVKSAPQAAALPARRLPRKRSTVGLRPRRKSRKPTRHPAPERRRTNKFRESHSVRGAEK